jgi:hypothetical protein
MWCNMMRSTKSQKALVLHYSIDSYAYLSYYKLFLICWFLFQQIMKGRMLGYTDIHYRDEQHASM